MTRYDDKILGTILLTITGVAMAAFATSSLVHFSAQLSPEEQQIVAFAPAIPHLTIRMPTSTAGLSCPVPINHNRTQSLASMPTPQDFPPGVPPAPEPALPAISQEIGSGLTVSFIMLDNSKRLAIINGKIVREGDQFQKATISRIERTRVLLREGKGEQWLLLN